MRADLLVQVGALEHLAALAVDDLALAAHHVVVLEDVLAGLEVLRLDLALRGAIAPVTRLFSIGTSSGIFSAVSTRSTQSDLNSRIRSSCERQVEPGLARVALAAGTTAQLVVDAARLVALGADDVEAADLLDLVVLGRDLLLDLLDHRRPGGFVLLGVSRPGRGPACAAPGRRGTRPSRRA